MTIYELLVLAFDEHTVVTIFSTVTGVIGAATLLVEAAEKIANITPSDKDNQYVGDVKRKLGKVVAFLDKVAMSKRDK